jgi:hypothetical protein
MERLARSLGRVQIGPPILIRSDTAMDAARADKGNWKGAALLVWETEGWTMFNDLSRSLDCIPPELWQAVAEDGSLVFAGYNDSIA